MWQYQWAEQSIGSWVRGGARRAYCCACVRKAEGVAPAPGRKREAAEAGRLASPFRPVPMEALGKLKQFDAYPKTLEDFRVKTCGGATGRPRRDRGFREGGVLELGPGAWTLDGLLVSERVEQRPF